MPSPIGADSTLQVLVQRLIRLFKSLPSVCHTSYNAHPTFISINDLSCPRPAAGLALQLAQSALVREAAALKGLAFELKLS
jgi:hypothetical protein